MANPPLSLKEQIFRAVGVLERHGAKFENVRFLATRDGLSIRVIDPARRFLIMVPREVLLDVDRLDFSGDEMQLDTNGLTQGLATVWTDLLNISLSAQRIARLREISATFHTLPSSIHPTLVDGLHLSHLCRPDALASPATAKKYLIGARTISAYDKSYLMPLLEFANHDPDAGTGFLIASNGISITGRARDEVRVNYTAGDAFHFIEVYHFPGKAKHAYSITLKVRHGDLTLQIWRRYINNVPYRDGIFSPRITTRANGVVDLSHLMLGSRDKPDLTIPAFVAAWEKAGFKQGEEIFDAIYRANLGVFMALLSALEGIEGTAAEWLRQATHQQLELMAYH